ncbi:hypothetical protein J4Q44_G00064160 [Coregonus suidteri]|uniref:Uncharacterized protein n=1 Tax=Coregonus suidteri TaxID=861788 RepID=A0AAN8MCB6_9TELE
MLPLPVFLPLPGTWLCLIFLCVAGRPAIAPVGIGFRYVLYTCCFVCFSSLYFFIYYGRIIKDEILISCSEQNGTCQ